MRLAVFASGSGTNFQAILDAFREGTVTGKIRCCVSDAEDAGALERARRQSVPTAVVSPHSFDAPASFGRALLDVLREREVDFIALAGYTIKLPSNVVTAFRGRITNIHPALLPAFGGKGMYGRHVHEAVIEYGVHWTGATVHLVDEEYDQGPVVLQQPVPVLADDTPETLADRVRTVEHQLYPEVLRLFADDRVRLDGRTVRIDDYDPHSPPTDLRS